MAWGFAADLENASLFSTVTIYSIIRIRLPAPHPLFPVYGCELEDDTMVHFRCLYHTKEEHTMNIEQKEGKHIDNVFCGVQVSEPFLLH